MIEFYMFGTPNGKKISIALEEMKLEYNLHVIDIMNDEQFNPEFLAISPNNKIPAIVDKDNGMSLMESGAILYYLARKTDSFLPKNEKNRWQAIEWLNWQMGGFGPMLGQANHFLKFNEGKSEYAEKRYGDEAKRLYGVLDKHLSKNEYVAGEYSIADMAIWPWCTGWKWQNINMESLPNIKRWYGEIAKRKGVIQGYNVPKPAEIPIP